MRFTIKGLIAAEATEVIHMEVLFSGFDVFSSENNLKEKIGNSVVHNVFPFIDDLGEACPCEFNMRYLSG